MIIASWNVNSIKMRLPILLDFLKNAAPDVLVLQELKCESAAFPFLEIESAGYTALVKGQKTYNGVALLTRHKATLRTDVLPGDTSDEQARYIEADVNGWIIGGLYLPNGNPLGTEKFMYKLSWLKRFHAHAKSLLALERPVLLGGDYNIIPEPLDARHPEAWQGDALFQPGSRGAYRQLLNMGYSDAFRLLHKGTQHAYTFWDYQQNSFERDNGIRIDHLLLSPEAADKLTKCWIDRDLRARDKASDHTPILASFL